jgi:hypothetical protein
MEHAPKTKKNPAFTALVLGKSTSRNAKLQAVKDYPREEAACSKAHDHAPDAGCRYRKCLAKKRQTRENADPNQHAKNNAD